jgi:hypothetical protein
MYISLEKSKGWIRDAMICLINGEEKEAMKVYQNYHPHSKLDEIRMKINEIKINMG